MKNTLAKLVLGMALVVGFAVTTSAKAETYSPYTMPVGFNTAPYTQPINTNPFHGGGSFTIQEQIRIQGTQQQSCCGTGQIPTYGGGCQNQFFNQCQQGGYYPISSCGMNAMPYQNNMFGMNGMNGMCGGGCGIGCGQQMCAMPFPIYRGGCGSRCGRRGGSSWGFSTSIPTAYGPFPISFGSSSW